MVVIRFADDTIMGLQDQTDADHFLENLRERLGKFGLELHPDKTRRIEFGRFAEQNRKRRGEGKPETFDFLGFTHISGKNGLGRFMVRRTTIRKRMRAKLRQVKQQLRERMHDPVPQTGQWLKSVVQGFFNYYAVPGNLTSLGVFRDRVLALWWRTIRRRSQKRRISWTRILVLAQRWIPQPRALHPFPDARYGRVLCSPHVLQLCRQSSEIRTGCANKRPSGSIRGAPRNGCPYRDRQQSRKIDLRTRDCVIHQRDGQCQTGARSPLKPLILVSPNVFSSTME